KVPPVIRSGTTVTLQVACLFILCEIGLIVLASVKADRDNVKIFSGVKRYALERSRQTIKHLVTQHRAFVIDERDDDGPAGLKEFAELYDLTAFVLYFCIKRQLIAKFLIDTDLLKRVGHPVRSGLSRVVVSRRIKRRIIMLCFLSMRRNYAQKRNGDC